MLQLNETILIRGWIKQVPWPVLDESLPEGSETAKVQVKRLRRALAVKARFYGQPEQAELWLSGRLASERWQNTLLTSLMVLADRPDPEPQSDQKLSQWFEAAVCGALPKIVTSLAEAVNWLMRIDEGLVIPEHQKTAEAELRPFVEKHAEALHYTPKQAPLPVPVRIREGEVAPLEWLVIPEHLNGAEGSNRALAPCRLDAAHDLAAIHSWLALKTGSRKTYEAYKKELERLLLWAIIERGKAFSSLNTDDCQAYLEFLSQLTADQTQWVTCRPALKKHGNWRPFYYRPPANEAESSSPPARVLSPATVRYAKTVISNCMDWLVKQQYLQHNNFDGLARLSGLASGLNTQRAFTAEQMQLILKSAEAWVNPEADNFRLRRRTVFILRLALSTGLRLHELAGARYGDIEWLEDTAGPQYFITVTGKGQRTRKTSLPTALVEEIKAYLKFQGKPTYFEFLPREAPLIPNLRDPTGRKPLTTAGLHKILADFFSELFEQHQAEGSEDNRLLAKLQQASAHWLRHSYGSYLANDKQVPLAYIRDELGHANISTTSRYLNSDAKARQKVVSEAFQALGGTAPEPP